MLIVARRWPRACPLWDHCLLRQQRCLLRGLLLQLGLTFSRVHTRSLVSWLWSCRCVGLCVVDGWVKRGHRAKSAPHEVMALDNALLKGTG